MELPSNSGFRKNSPNLRGKKEKKGISIFSSAVIVAFGNDYVSLKFCLNLSRICIKCTRILHMNEETMSTTTTLSKTMSLLTICRTHCQKTTRPASCLFRFCWLINNATNLFTFDFEHFSDLLSIYSRIYIYYIRSYTYIHNLNSVYLHFHVVSYRNRINDENKECFH